MEAIDKRIAEVTEQIKQLTEMKPSTKTLGEKVSSLIHQAAEAKKVFDKLQEEVNNFEKNKEKLTQDVEVHSMVLESQNTELAKRQSKFKTAQAELEKLQQELTTINQQLATKTAEVDKGIEEINASGSRLNQLSEMFNKLRMAEEELATAKEKLMTLEQELTQQKQFQESATKAYDKLLAQYEL